MSTNQTRKAKAIYSEISIARESATIICILTETERQREEWKSFQVGKMEGFRYDLIASCCHGEVAEW